MFHTFSIFSPCIVVVVENVIIDSHAGYVELNCLHGENTPPEPGAVTCVKAFEGFLWNFSRNIGFYFRTSKHDSNVISTFDKTVDLH